MKGAAVAMRGDAELRIVLQSCERRAFPCLCSQELFAKRLKREGERGTCDRAIISNHDAASRQPCLSLSVRPRTALGRLYVDRTVNGVKFCQIRQAPFCELHRRD